MADVAELVARRSYGKLLAWLTARHRDLSAAEDALSEAFAAALETWPRTGTPDHPEAWLLTTARRRMIDQARKSRTGSDAIPHLKLMAEELADAGEDALPDRRLALMFACAHPAIEDAIRAPLILQTLLGFDAGMIASAFLVSPRAMGQRLVRAKARIRETGIPFRVPGHDELTERLPPVLDAVYAMFAEGWSDPAGLDIGRRNLTGECLWLGRLLVSLLPDQPEALGLLALMLYAESRRGSRRGGDGSFIPLGEQDMKLWDGAMIAEAEACLLRASAMRQPGRFQLEAAVQSAHAARRATGRTDWKAVAGLYDGLMQLTGSPVIAVNRAIAVAEAVSPELGLAELDEVAADPRLENYQPYWAARASLLARTGRREEADAAYQRAIGLESDPAARAFLQKRKWELGP